MPTYKNLPANRLELLDGNLIVDTPIEGNVVLVIGTAYSGPTGKQVLMSDSNVARKVYGANSPLLQKASEAKLGGAKNIVLYRIGGKSASLDGIFGADTYIRTVDQTATAGSDYSIYLGPQPNNALVACLIVFQGSKIVYSNVTGAEVDLGKIEVEGFDANTNIVIGTPTSPVLFSSVVVPGYGTETFQPAALDTKIFLEGAISDTAVITSVTKNGNALVVTTDYTFNATTGILTLVDAADGTDDYVVSYTRSATKSSAILGYTATGIVPTITLPTTGVNNGGVIGYVYKNGNPLTVTTDYTFNATTGIVTLVAATAPADVYSIGFAYNVVSGFTYSAGENNIGATWKKLYELLDAAYIDLETTIATEAVVDQAILDAPNIADGSVASNKLDYFRKYEDVDGEIVYEWSTVKTVYAYSGLLTDATHDATLNTTTVVGDADVDSNGQPKIAKQFSEVNFVHQFGEFLNGLTENDRFVLGFIGTSTPTSLANVKVASWIGTAPEVDFDGDIISNGTGLLGNKFMAGTTTKTAGFYKTDTGYPDGIPQQDSNGAYIDLGKFLSVVSGLVSLPSSPVAGTSGQVVNGAGVYCGLATTVIPGNSTTNEVVSRVAIPVLIKKPKLDELSYAGYVVFMEKDRGTVVVSGELATNANSDYDYISTSIIVRNITNAIRTRLDVYIGKGIDEIRLAAMQTAVDGVMQQAVRDGLIKKYAATVIPTSTFGVTIPYTIVPVFELRDINNVVKLSYDV